MRRHRSSTRWLLFAGVIAILVALAYAQPPSRPARLILGPDEGDRLGSHYIKADPHSGSMRLGVGLQRLTAGQGIPTHLHEAEDEVLFIHSGTGVGSVGEERRSIGPGSTLYVPEGTWHGVAPGGDMELLWVASPPRFAETLRAIASNAPRASQYGYRDSGYFFLPRLGIIAAILAVAAALVAALTPVQRFRLIAMYDLGATLATIATIYAMAPGQLPPVVFVIGVLAVAFAVLLGAFGGLGLRTLVGRVAGAR